MTRELGVNNTRKKIRRLIPEVPSCTTLPICLSHDEIDTADDCHNVGEHLPLEKRRMSIPPCHEKEL